MNLHVLFGFVAALLLPVQAATISYDRVDTFVQPDPVTISERSAVLLKPQLRAEYGCYMFPAVNAAGDTNSGLDPSSDVLPLCEIGPRSGSQVYGRATWYKDRWAIMYAWYFPTGFYSGYAWRRHDWSSAVVWIDNPAFEKPTILALSTSRSATKYKTYSPPPEYSISGETTPTLYHTIDVLLGPGLLDWTDKPGNSQQLIMWSQLPEAARLALNTADFGKAKVPFNDDNFEAKLEKAWPF